MCFPGTLSLRFTCWRESAQRTSRNWRPPGQAEHDQGWITASSDVGSFQTSGCNWPRSICSQVRKSASLICDGSSVPSKVGGIEANDGLKLKRKTSALEAHLLPLVSNAPRHNISVPQCIFMAETINTWKQIFKKKKGGGVHYSQFSFCYNWCRAGDRRGWGGRLVLTCVALRSRLLSCCELLPVNRWHLPPKARAGKCHSSGGVVV